MCGCKYNKIKHNFDGGLKNISGWRKKCLVFQCNWKRSQLAAAECKQAQISIGGGAGQVVVGIRRSVAMNTSWLAERARGPLRLWYFSIYNFLFSLPVSITPRASSIRYRAATTTATPLFRSLFFTDYFRRYSPNERLVGMRPGSRSRGG